MKNEIIFWDRSDQKQKIEKVYGAEWISFLYNHPMGEKVRGFFRTRLFSQFYGSLQNQPLSTFKVPPFIAKFDIPITDYEFGSKDVPEQAYSYKNFNEFFIRKFRQGKRNFDQTPHIMPAFSEARYYGWESVSTDMTFPVKGAYLSAESLLGSLNEKWGGVFRGGALLLARLCPVDYHRFHYPLDGKTLAVSDEGSELESVNPIALAKKPEIFLKNLRRVSILETKDFGKLAYIEVGATCVGKIVQSHESSYFYRGDEKGYFLFGGSTVIVLGEPGRWKPAQDILEQTFKKQEVLVRLGEPIGILEQSH